jgi:hypothetical protein
MHSENACISAYYIFITITWYKFPLAFIIFVRSFPSLFFSFDMIYKGTSVNYAKTFITLICCKLHLFFVIYPFIRLFRMRDICLAWIGWWGGFFLLNTLLFRGNHGLTRQFCEISWLSVKKYFITLLISCGLNHCLWSCWALLVLDLILLRWLRSIWKHISDTVYQPSVIIIRYCC